MNKKRVLMVDDEAGFTRMAKVSLEARGGYLVEVVNESRDAISTARRIKPDIILLDLIMPGMDGGDVAGLLKADPDLKDIPIIFLSATVTANAAANDGLVGGGHVFLSKPVALQDLMRCIETCLAMKGNQPPTVPPATGAAPER